MMFKKAMAGLLGLVVLCSIQPICYGPDVSISNLPNTLTSEPADRTTVWFALDDTTANQTQKVSLVKMRELMDDLLTGAITASTNQFTDPVLVTHAKVGHWIVAEAYTADAEMRLITAISGNVITVSRNFQRAHAVGDRFVLTDSAERNAKWWGCRGDGTTNDAAAIQAAIDDFDTSVSDVGGDDRERRANNLFFPPGEYVIGSLIRLPYISPYSTARQVINGHNAALITTGFNGPFFARRWEGTHTGSDNSPSLVDGGNPWVADELTVQASFAFNKTDLATAPPEENNDYSAGTITANTTSTVTVTLGGGTDNDWDTGDEYVVTSPTNKWYFQNLTFRDHTVGFGSVGTAHVFDWSLFRMVVNNCTFSQFDAVWKSDDEQQDVRQYFQSNRITNCTFDSCNYVINGAKAWDLLFSGNLTDSCNNIVNLRNLDSAALIQGQISNNTIQGSGAGNLIFIRGPHALNLSYNYFESNNTGTSPYVRINDGQQPRGLVIAGNHIQLHASQLDDATYFPFDLHRVTEGLTFIGNQSGASLIDLTKNIEVDPDDELGEGWLVAGNHTLNAHPNSGFERLSRGTRVVNRSAFIRTSGNSLTNLNFGNSPNGTAPMQIASEAGIGAVMYVEARITGVNQDNRTGATDQVAYHIAALFRHQTTTTQNLQKEGSTQRLHTDIESAQATEWDADFAITSKEFNFTADHTTETLTAVGHTFANDDAVYLTVSGGTLPAELDQNRTYWIRNVSGNNFQLARYPGSPTSVAFGDNGTATMIVNQEDIELQVQGEATGPNDDVDWYADVEIIIGRMTQ